MIKEIVLATKNSGKLKEIKEILKIDGIRISTVLDFAGCPEVEEDGSTFEENALKKAKAVCEFTGKPALSDDSGLEVTALGMMPGVKSARFAGPGCSYEENNTKLLKLMEKIPESKRDARFVCVALLYLPGGRQEVTEGTCKGYISKESRGEGGFGYDPVFILPEYGKTMAELGLEIKNKVSHRAEAFKKMAERIKKCSTHIHGHVSIGKYP